MVDYISSVPCPECGMYRSKDEMHVGRDRCDPCQKAYWEQFYQPDMDAKIKAWQEEAEHARMTESGIILLGDR